MVQFIGLTVSENRLGTDLPPAFLKELEIKNGFFAVCLVFMHRINVPREQYTELSSLLYLQHSSSKLNLRLSFPTYT